MTNRVFPKVVHRKFVVCQSDRLPGSRILLAVLHDTEGGNVPKSSRDLVGLGNFFNVLSTQASSSVANDEDGQSARFVRDSRKAWTQGAFNSVAVSIEQIGFASDVWTSTKKEPQLLETARWLAYWSRHHGIPLVHSTSRGVCQHRDLGLAGGGHVDVSASYPLGDVLSDAKTFRKLQSRKAG
jgi:hypothetical protein